jgi:proteasome activator subunit 3 (PA28 gamma)
MFQAEDLILKGFPKKIVELNELLDTAQFGRRDLTEVRQPLNIPVPDPVIINRLVQDV